MVCEHGVEVECRAERPADIAERRELRHRARQLGRPGFELVEQAHVLDGDDRLVGEGLEQGDLPVVKGRSSAREMTIVPSARPSRSMGTTRRVRKPA